jgi:hypothetical protein
VFAIVIHFHPSLLTASMARSLPLQWSRLSLMFVGKAGAYPEHLSVASLNGRLLALLRNRLAWNGLSRANVICQREHVNLLKKRQFPVNYEFVMFIVQAPGFCNLQMSQMR